MYDIHQSSQLYQNCIMLAQFAVRRLRDRMHRRDRFISRNRKVFILLEKKDFSQHWQVRCINV